jgi:hypothetical protein
VVVDVDELDDVEALRVDSVLVDDDVVETVDVEAVEEVDVEADEEVAVEDVERDAVDDDVNELVLVLVLETVRVLVVDVVEVEIEVPVAEDVVVDVVTLVEEEDDVRVDALAWKLDTCFVWSTRCVPRAETKEIDPECHAHRQVHGKQEATHYVIRVKA